MRKIKLTKGFEAIVDDDDYEELSKYKWQYHLGYAKRGDYNQLKRNNNSVKMHRQIMSCPKGMVVHHKNHNRLDNRKENLLICDQRENHLSQLQKKDNSKSKYQGIYQRKKTGSWTARIKYNYKHIYLGTFKNEIHAAAAYNRGAEKYFGRLAIKNDVPDYFPSKEDREKIRLKNLRRITGL